MVTVISSHWVAVLVRWFNLAALPRSRETVSGISAHRLTAPSFLWRKYLRPSSLRNDPSQNSSLMHLRKILRKASVTISVTENPSCWPNFNAPRKNPSPKPVTITIAETPSQPSKFLSPDGIILRQGLYCNNCGMILRNRSILLSPDGIILRQGPYYNNCGMIPRNYSSYPVLGHKIQGVLRR